MMRNNNTGIHSNTEGRASELRGIFAQRLHEARKSKGITGEALAFELDIAPCSVYWWESGRNLPRTERLIEIAIALGVSLDWLCGLEDAE